MTNAPQQRAVGASPSPPRARAIQLPGIDGMRALAVSAVLVYHLSATWLPGGYLGVDVFFVISGYLITRLLIAERVGTGRISLRHFWIRRARRILSPLFPMLLVTVAATALIDRSMLHALRTEVLGALSYTSNWVQIGEHQSYFAKFGPPSLLQHLWSLAVEEQFYLVWPPIVIALLLWGRRKVAVVAILGALGSATAMAVLYQPAADPSPIYYSTGTHSAGLFVGAALAIAWPAATAAHGEWSQRRMTVSTALAGIGLAVIALGYWLLDEYGAATYRGGILAVSMASALLIVGAGHGRNALGRLLSQPAARWVGARSYGLYLWHWPVFVLGDRVLGQRTLRVAAVEVAVAVLLAAASYRWIEQPVLRYGYRGALDRGWRSMRGGALPVAAVVAAACVFAVVALVRAPAPPLSELDQQLAAAQLAALQAPSPSPPPMHAPSPSPSEPDPSGPPPGDQVTALGDSVMLAASLGLRDQLPGIQIDAVVSRAMQAAPSILAGLADSGGLRRVVLLGLGTNGPFPRDLLEDILSQLGPDRKVFLVNVFLPTRPWGDEVNRTLSEVALTHPNVHLIDWQGAAGAHEDLLYTDEIHPRAGEGADLYAQTVVAVMSAAQRPPAAPALPVVYAKPPADGGLDMLAGLSTLTRLPATPPRARLDTTGAVLAALIFLLALPVSMSLGTHASAARAELRPFVAKPFAHAWMPVGVEIPDSPAGAWPPFRLPDRARSPPWTTTYARADADAPLFMRFLGPPRLFAVWGSLD